uniref:Cadherin EGF LAG seven-pass G-type receptor 2 n=1 Tax=Lygus hesperus TaxID=30085 RepID=A0A0A9Y5S3_LYGHE
MAIRQPICQMCRVEICALCKEKIMQCKCPCPNFVICKICSVQEKTLPFCDDPVHPAPVKSTPPMGSMISPSMSPMMAIAMMMMNMNKGKSCECDKRSTVVPQREEPRKSKSSDCCCKKPSKIEICTTATKHSCQCGDTHPQRLCRCEEAKPACAPSPFPHRQPQQGSTCICVESHREPICQTFVKPDCDSRGLQRQQTMQTCMDQQYSYAPAQQYPCQQVQEYICQPMQQYPCRFEETPCYGDPREQHRSPRSIFQEDPQSRRTTQGPQDRRKTQGPQDLRKTQDQGYDGNERRRSPSIFYPTEDEPEPPEISPREDGMTRKSSASPSKRGKGCILL